MLKSLLPPEPTELDYEDQVAALLQAFGHYIETSIVLRQGPEEVLEYDVIATPVSDYENPFVVEVKSGKHWGLGDIFKLSGQIRYTQHQTGFLVHKAPMSSTKEETVRRVLPDLPIRVIQHSQPGAAPAKLAEEFKMSPATTLADNLREAMLVTAWASKLAERFAYRRFRLWAKTSSPIPNEITLAKRYCTELDQSLFGKSPLARAALIYNAYKRAPKLSGALISHVQSSTAESLKDVRKSVYDNDRRPEIQYIAALEHVARTAIIKNAYDAILQEKSNSENREPWAGSSWVSRYRSYLPGSFCDGLIELDKNPHSRLAAYFLQVFVQVLGGFYLYSDEEDIDLVSQLTTVPKDDIPGVLALLDSFFPFNASWIEKTDTGLCYVKMVPAYLRSSGCHLRHQLYGANWSRNTSASSWTQKWARPLSSFLGQS